MLGKLNCYMTKASIFLITAALIAGMAGCSDITRNLEIRTWYDLDAIRNNLSGHHILMNDLDSSTPGYDELVSPTANGGKGWQPIGGYFSYVFEGTFDGQGYEIRDLFINRLDELGVGLFGIVDEGGVIENVGVVNATVTGYVLIGGLVGGNAGTVSNSYSRGSVTGEECVGSLVGANEWVGTVSNSYSTGSVTGEWRVGGLVGDNRGTVSNSYSTSSVTGNSGVGGLVGFNIDDGSLSNSFYNYDEVLINGENIITIGALFSEDFEEWLANDKLLDIKDRLSQEDDYYVVNNVTDFKELLAFGQNATLKFRLANDLDLATEPNFYIPYFAGEFDGNGYKVSNLSFSFDFVSHVGLFGYLAPGGKITQVGLENVNITGASFVGGLVGYNHGGTVSDSYCTGNVTGSVSVTDDEGIGGLVGYNVKGTVSDCYATGSVTGNSRVGGLVGYSSGTVSNSYSTGSVTGEWRVGGLVGLNSGTVENSYSTGSVTGDSWGDGLAGSNSDTITNSYSNGGVPPRPPSEDSVGGLVGQNYGTVSNSFWDIETSGQITSDGGTGMNTTEMKDLATFSGAGWNIITVANPSMRNASYVWNIVDDVTYPFLSWQPI